MFPTFTLSAALNALIHPDAAILVVSASDGPTPNTRLHAESAADAGLPVVAVFMNKEDQVDDDELMELVSSETNELLNTAGYVADGIPFVQGSALKSVSASDAQEENNGIRDLVEVLGNVN